MTYFTEEEIALGCKQQPAILSRSPIKNKLCKDCAGCGVISLFDPRHHVGWFNVFCDCSIGQDEESIALNNYIYGDKE